MRFFNYLICGLGLGFIVVVWVVVRVWVRVGIGERVRVGVGLVRGLIQGKFGDMVTIRVRVEPVLGLLLGLG